MLGGGGIAGGVLFAVLIISFVLGKGKGDESLTEMAASEAQHTTSVYEGTEAVAEETGCQVDVYLSEGYPAVWNHEALYQRITAQLGADAPQLLEKPVLAAEDFSFYQQYVPGAFFFLGTGDTPQLHAPDFAFDDEAVLPRGVEFLKKLLLLP